TAQQHGVDDGENRDVQADAQRQRSDRGCGKAWTLEELTNAVPKVPCKCAHTIKKRSESYRGSCADILHRPDLDGDTGGHDDERVACHIDVAVVNNGVNAVGELLQSVSRFHRGASGGGEKGENK